MKVEIKKSMKIDDVTGYSAFLTFDYDARIVNIVRALPNRWWHNKDKKWEIPLTSLETIVEKITWQEIDISGHYVEIQKPNTSLPTDFHFKTKPFKHQKEGFEYGLVHDRFLLADEQGLGKTKQVIDISIAKKLQRGYKHCLIVCGVNGLKWNWVNEIHTHSNEGAYILGQRLKKKSGKIEIGSLKDRLSDVQNIKDISEYFIITNIETLRNKDITAEITKLCEDKTIGIVAIDEIHKCKDVSSQQGKAILKINSEVKIAMTGTPLMNKPFDVYIILKWLGYENHSLYSFKQHYGEFGGFGGYELIRYKNLDQLQSQLDGVMIRRLKSDVLDLPEKIYIDEYVEMSHKQSVVYNEIGNELKSNIDLVKTSPNPLAALIRLRQATGWTGILSSDIHESAKLDRMLELVKETIKDGRKVVIFSNWTKITDQVIKIFDLRKYNYAIITGETSDSDRQAQVDKFQNDENCKIMLGTIGAMGTGITLTAGTVEIFLDEPWNRALKDQAVDRCHRVGTTENITIYTLITKNTIDERIHELVEQKGEMADALIDGQVNMNKSNMVDFLLS